MKNLNILSKLCSPIVDAQSSDVGYDGRFTVGSPSGGNYSALLKLVSALVLILTLGVAQMWGMDSNYTIGSKVTSLVDGDYVAWGTANNNLAYVFESNWGKCNGTKSQWILFKVVKISGSFYLQNTADNKYMYSSATKKIELNASSKTAITLDASYRVYNSTAGTYTLNSTGIRPYTSNKYTDAFLYKVNLLKVTYDGNGNTGGSVPTDNTNYLSGATVTVKSNSGSLAKTGYTFAGWNTKADGTGTTYAATGSATFTISASTTLYAKWEAAGCANYSFHFGTRSSTDWNDPADYCFVASTDGDGNSGVYYYLEDFVLPAKPHYYVGWQGSWNTTDAKSADADFSDLCFGLVRDNQFSCGYKTLGTYSSGNNQGAIGTLRVRSSYTDNNKYIDFIPGGYVLRLSDNGGSSYTSTELIPASESLTETVWTTDITTVSAALASSGKFFVDLKTSSDHVWAPNISQVANISAMGYKKDGGTEAGSWGTGLSSGMRGKFRIWADNCNKNWNCHFVPYYHITYNGSGASGSTVASTDVSCEGNATERTVKAAANGFTVPTGYTFGGWATSSARAAAGTVDYAANADVILTSDIVLYAVWTPKEYSVTATLTNVSANTAFPSSFTYTGSATTALNRTLSANTGYNLPTSITVTMGGSTLTKDTHYTYDSSTGAFAFIATITGNIVITVSGVAKTYSNTLEREGGTTGSTSVTTTYNSNTLTGYTAPTKTGYTFGGYWSGDDGTGTEVINTSGALKASVTVSAVAWTNSSSQWVKDGAVTMYAKWTAKNYTVTLNDGSGSGGDGTVSVTYNSNTNISDVTVPTYTGNDFRGYYTSAGGEGTKVIDGEGAWIRGTEYVDASGNWVYDGSPTLHAYWTAYTYENYRTMCAPVTCGAPDLSSPTPTAYGATISWTDAGKAGTLDHYEYAVWADGAVEPTSGYTSTGTTKSATVSGLLSNTLYNYKVRRVCSGDDESSWSDGTFTTSYVALTFSVPTGASAVAGQNSNVALPDAEVPTDCGDCWVFVGWTTSTYAESSSAPAKLFAEGEIAHLAQADGSTLYAVYKKTKYRIVGDLASISADEYYVLTFDSVGQTSAMANAVTNTYYVTEEEMPIKEDNTGAYIESPDEDAIWKFTGTTSAGRFQNVGNDKYLDLSNSSNPPIASSTSDYVNITVFNSSNKMFDIESNATDGNYLQLYSKGWGVDDDHSGYYSCRLFKRAGSSYTTVPDCRTFTVTWDVNNGATTSTSNVTKCQGYLASLPDNPSNTTLSSCQTNGKFMGWSPMKVMPAQDVVPTGMFSEVEYSPEITQDTTFYAVFAEEHSGATGATDRTYTFTSASWEDDENAWSSGAAGYAMATGRGVQVTTGTTGANATTKSSYNDVTKVVVTYSTNASKGEGSIKIEVGGTTLTGYSSTNANYTSGDGTADKTIDFTPVAPATNHDGAVKITVTCSTNSIYIKSVQIFYTGSTTTYDQYRTACCNDPQLKFLDGEGDPTTEYVIVREDLASASSVVEIECDISSLNTTEDITWKQTKRIKTDYHTANTWNASPTDRCQIDITNHKISAYETGSWQITIEQLMGSTNYCDGTATVNILVKTIDKFIDAVNGNFSGEAQSLEDVGNGIILPTEATFSTNNGCADGTTRRLIGWIKASDLATYASGRRVDMIDDLKTGDASNKVIAPGTKVEATGVTWYAVWGVEK